MKSKTLLILAAGMGSRFGGLKQIESIGPSGEFILDYSIYDAIRAGFDKVVFIIKEENYDIFRDTIGKRIEDKIKVEYVFQSNDDIPEGYVVPKERVKPLGTGHAVLAARNIINEPFAVITADDFYGQDGFKKVAEFLDNNTIDTQHALIGYKIANTLSEYGSVKRGVCEVENGYLVNITESIVDRENNKIIVSPINSGEPYEVDDNHAVAMSFYGFKPNIFDLVMDYFKDFLKTADLLNEEFFLPDAIQRSIDEKKYEFLVPATSSLWYGITYKEDKEKVVEAINELISKGEYKSNLWE